MKSKTTIRSNDMAKTPTTKVVEKPVFVKNCMKNLNSTIALANASNMSAKDATRKPEENRYNLDR